MNSFTKLGLRFARPVAYPLARAVRNLTRKFSPQTTFIAITGSGGKTSTKQLLSPILRGQGTVWTPDYIMNGPEAIAKTVFTLRPKTRYCLQELATAWPGMLAQSAAMFQPEVSIVTKVERDHYTAFRGLENTALEKGTLVEVLPADGVAVLNRDDPHVWAMRERTNARILSFGLDDNADLRGHSFSSAWPERFSMTVEYQGRQLQVQTRLLGEHWAMVVLASLAGAAALGVPLEDAAKALRSVEPAPRRMSPVETVDGITFVRDDWKAPLWTIQAGLDFLHQAKASRTIAVIGTISDFPGDGGRRYRQVARKALAAADHVFFVGSQAHSSRKVATGPDADRLKAFDTVYELDQHLHGFLRSGDLVLVKGSGIADHLERLVLSRTGEIACWLPRCQRIPPCDGCKLRMKPYIPAS